MGMSYLCRAFLFISFALCGSLPVPAYDSEGHLMQRNPLRGAYWIRAGFRTQQRGEITPNARHSDLIESEIVAFCQLTDIPPVNPDCPFIVEKNFDPQRIHSGFQTSRASRERQHFTAGSLLHNMSK
ncbi:hypothetical protein TNCT_80991 [Trichonephila clavata]|uniref:Uncharacterized protein n=1 Tax=Trichonephila clavata TaxID=2740835 RepID=A0A8X6GXY9_TRICU|nr:hypothetical protein TNCT_80991 [Trichonephila clavata]